MSYLDQATLPEFLRKLWSTLIERKKTTYRLLRVNHFWRDIVTYNKRSASSRSEYFPWSPIILTLIRHQLILNISEAIFEWPASARGRLVSTLGLCIRFRPAINLVCLVNRCVSNNGCLPRYLTQMWHSETRRPLSNNTLCVLASSSKYMATISGSGQVQAPAPVIYIYVFKFQHRKC